MQYAVIGKIFFVVLQKKLALLFWYYENIDDYPLFPYAVGCIVSCFILSVCSGPSLGSHILVRRVSGRHSSECGGGGNG